MLNIKSEIKLALDQMYVNLFHHPAMQAEVTHVEIEWGEKIESI